MSLDWKHTVYKSSINCGTPIIADINSLIDDNDNIYTKSLREILYNGTV